MSDFLDAPTIFRNEAPTLGVPVIALTYRPNYLRQPWWKRLTRWLVHALYRPRRWWWERP